jgi:hypothetical protein
MAQGCGDSARVSEGVETTGYGSSATWEGGPSDYRRRDASAGQTNERVELARYTVTAGERVIHGQRILGVVRLVDNPASGEGRHYVIERELTTMAELEAIVSDYLQQADRWDAIPAAGPCCLLAELAEQDR